MEDTDKQVKVTQRTLIFTMILPPLDPLGGIASWQKETRED